MTTSAAVLRRRDDRDYRVMMWMVPFYVALVIGGAFAFRAIDKGMSYSPQQIRSAASSLVTAAKPYQGRTSYPSATVITGQLGQRGIAAVSANRPELKEWRNDLAASGAILVVSRPDLLQLDQNVDGYPLTVTVRPEAKPALSGLPKKTGDNALWPFVAVLSVMMGALIVFMLRGSEREFRKRRDGIQPDSIRRP